MKPNHNQKKFNLNKQTVQRLDSAKLNQIKAGDAQEEAGTTWFYSIAASITVTYTGSITGTVIVACTVADAKP
jgi:hypothetical protein